MARLEKKPVTQISLDKIIRTLEEAFASVETESQGLPPYWQTPVIILLDICRKALGAVKDGYQESFKGSPPTRTLH